MTTQESAGKRSLYAASILLIGAGLAATIGFGDSLMPSSEPAVRPEDVLQGLERLERPPVVVDELRDPAIALEALSLARAVLYKGGAEPGNLGALEGRRVFLCAFDDHGLSTCSTGKGASLDQSVKAAALELRAKNPPAEASSRLKIDFVTWEAAELGVLSPTVSERSTGAFGYLVESESDLSWVTPSEVLIADLVHGGRLRADAWIAQRSPGLAGPRYRPVLTEAWVETADGGGDALRLYRAHAADQEPVTAERMLERAVLAADYLVASQEEDGRLRYKYDVADDDTSDDYNMLRHAGSTYALLQIYERTGYKPYLAAAERGIDYLLAHSRREERVGPMGGGDAMFVVEGPSVKLGGAGLSLLVLAQYTLSTGDERYLDQARAFARFLVSQQHKDGEYNSYAPLVPGETAKKRVSRYYPGEAIVGLTRLYTADPNPAWLSSARLGADWLIDVRDKGVPVPDLLNDHWLLIGLSDLLVHTDDRRYFDHSLRVARAVEYQGRLLDDATKLYPDYRGGYYEPPRSTPAATRAEGLVAVMDSCATAKEDCAWVESLLHQTLSHMTQSQLLPQDLWWVQDRAVAVGGFTGGIFDLHIRNDYVQHAMSAMLGAERLLAAKDGRALPGSLSWRSQRSAPVALSPEEVNELRRPALAVRGGQ